MLEELFIGVLIVSRMRIEQALTEGLLRPVCVLTAGHRKRELGLDLLTGKGGGMGMGILNTTDQCPTMGARMYSGCPEERVLAIQRSQAKCHCKGYICMGLEG